MKINFDDGGYLEFQRSKKPYHIFVSVAVKKPDNPLELLVNSAEVHLSQLLEAVKSISGPIILQDEENYEENSSKSNKKRTKE